MGLWKMLRALFRPRPPPPPPRPADARLEQDPWLGGIFARLSNRYQLGEQAPEGTVVLRRTGRARFNPMRVWLRPESRVVRGAYEIRAPGDREAAAAQCRAVLGERVAGRLSALGLSPGAESVEDWAGTVLVQLYEGRCDSPEQAAAAVRFICEDSEQQINLAAE
jgi:hypothetical protein